MFKLDVSAAYFAPVSLPMLSGDGVLENHQFDARFKRLTTAEVDALHAEASTKGLQDEPLLRRVLVGWRGVQDADGVETPFSPEALDRMMAINGLRAALARSFMQSLDPQQGAVLSAKN